MSDILDDLIKWSQEFVKWRNPGYRADSHMAPATMDVFVDIMDHYAEEPTSYLPSDMTDDQKKMFELFFGSIPGYKQLLEFRDTYKFWSDYLRNTGQTWADLEYPSRMSGFGAGSDLLNFTSSNLERFYDRENRLAERERERKVRGYIYSQRMEYLRRHYH